MSHDATVLSRIAAVEAQLKNLYKSQETMAETLEAIRESIDDMKEKLAKKETQVSIHDIRLGAMDVRLSNVEQQTQASKERLDKIAGGWKAIAAAAAGAAGLVKIADFFFAHLK